MKKRVISAAVLIVVSLSFVLLSEFTRVLLFGAAGALCATEFHDRLKEKGITTTRWVVYLYLAMMVFLTITHSGLMSYMAWFTVCVFIALFSGILHRDVSGEGAVYTLAILSYPSFLFGLMMIIAVSPRWGTTLALGAISSWVCDAAALFGGKAFGKHKLCPHVSPNNTVEGCLCGAASSVLAALIVFPFARRSIPISYWQCLFTAFAASSLGQIGDLAESLMKRFIGVKDFSNLIPGHGGFFDRTDSLMFSIPTAYFCLFIMHF